MAQNVPFVAYFRVVPSRGNGLRFDYVRALQKAAILVYEELQNVTEINIAEPGGGQAWMRKDINRPTRFSDHVDGMAVVPQIGEYPAQLRISGFYNISGNIEQVAADKTVFSSNEVKTGPAGEFPYLPSGQATTTVESEVVTLKGLLETAGQTAVPDDSLTLYRLEYRNIMWGARGHHFPRS